MAAAVNRDTQAAGQAGQVQAAAEAVAPEVGLLPGLDPLGFGRALCDLGAAPVRNPLGMFAAVARFAADAPAATMASLARTIGASPPGPVEPASRDRRFADPAWSRNPCYYAVQQGYLLWSRLLTDLVAASGLDERARLKAGFAVQAMIDALAPTNTLAGNPAALRKAWQTGGVSALRGVGNLLDDVARNRGRPRQVDLSQFRLGGNLAATPGEVVYRNQLMELIQYAPQTETAYEVPILCSPPWINKYYIMDLAPGRSFIEWAVQHGHTVFAISYRNPDASMQDVALDDYLLHGPYTAVDVITEITGSERVNVVGLCLGGTLTAMLLAHMAARRDDRVRSATLLNTLIDFSEPGPLGCFVDGPTVARVERRMARRGYLRATELSTTFDLLRANDLIWNYVASNWLMGERPPAFDVLAWNQDGVRMPARMFAFYLRYCYLENQLARGEMNLAGTRLNLDAITEHVYLVAAKEDHIVPWASAYRSTQLLASPRRFVLTSSGHIAGIVNPPNGKGRYWTNEALPPDPNAWLAGTAEHSDSWWDDWTTWIAERAGERRAPPSLGSDRYPALGPAPGVYVHDT